VENELVMRCAAASYCPRAPKCYSRVFHKEDDDCSILCFPFVGKPLTVVCIAQPFEAAIEQIATEEQT